MRLAKQWPDGPLVFGRDKEIAEFVRQRTPNTTGFGECSTIGVIRFGRLLGGVVYNNYRPNIGDVTVNFAFDDPRWATPSVMGSVCAYPFIQLGCKRVTALVRRKNKRSREFIEKAIGFKLEGCARKGFGDDDAMLYGLLRHECRWLKEK
jgi:RimJ/RimL family protein N-acetyltransferase